MSMQYENMEYTDIQVIHGNESEALTDYLENTKLAIEKCKSSLELGTTKTEQCGRIRDLCRQLNEVITLTLTSSAKVQEYFLRENPNLNRLSVHSGVFERNRDSGISSASGSSVWSGSQKASINSLSNLAIEDGGQATFSLGSCESSNDLLTAQAEAYDPSINSGVNLQTSKDHGLPVSKSSKGSLSVELSPTAPIAFHISQTCQIRLTTDTNEIIHFKLVPVHAKKYSDTHVAKCMGNNASKSSLTHSISGRSISSNDSVIDMTIAEDENTKGRPSAWQLNNLSTHSSSSSEDDNTKQGIPVTASELLKTSFGQIVDVQLVENKYIQREMFWYTF